MPIELRNLEIASVDRRFQRPRHLSKERGAEVVESIKKHGVIQPPRVDAKGRLLTGEVALWGARTAGLSAIAALVEDKEYSPVDALCLQLAADVQSIPQKPTERADGIERLMALTQWSPSEVSAQIGDSLTNLTRLRAMGKLEQPFRELVDAGLGISKGYELALMSPQQRMALLPRLQRGELTRADLHVARSSNDRARAETDSTPPAKVKVVLDDGRVVTVQAPELDMSRYVAAIQLLLRKARHAQKQGFALEEFVRSVRKGKSISTKGGSRVSV